MKTSVIDFRLLVVVIACVFNIAINTGCVTRDDERSSFKLDGLERAAGPQDDTPELMR